MKIAVLGVGSFVFGPAVLHDALMEHRLEGAELALFDPNVQMMELMAKLGQCMAGIAGIRARVSTHPTLGNALDGADFVISSAAVQLQKRFETDCQVIRERYPDHLITEFGGVAGISYTLRQIEMVRELAATMRQVCPDAWLLTSSNPLPRVCEATSRWGINTAGFCCNSSKVFGVIGRAMLGIDEAFPWPQAQARFAATMAGTNHLTFLLELRDRQSGEDVATQFQERVAQLQKDQPVTLRLMRDTGKYPPNGDTHMADFLPPTGEVPSLGSTWHGTGAERQQRLQLLRDVAEGGGDVAPLLLHRAWEKPVDFIAAVVHNQPREFVSLNLPNAGQLPQLPTGAYVETPVIVQGASVSPTRAQLPFEAARLAASAIAVNQALVDAGVHHDFGKLEEAVQRDPTILDKQRGLAAVRDCMRAHADLLRW